MSTARQEIEAERSAHANAVETLERLDRKLHRTFLAPIGTMLHGLSLACSLVYSSRSHEQVLVETRQAHRVKISVLKNQSQFSDPEQPGAKQSCHMWGTINQAELQCHKENIQVLESDLKESKPQVDVLGMCCLCCAVKSNGACIAIHIWLQMHEYGHNTISSQHSQEKTILYLSNPIYCRARVQILPWRCECRRGFRQALEWRCRLDQAQTNSWNLDHVTYYMSLRYLHTSSCFQPANTVAVAVASCFPRCPTACFLCRQCPLQDRR